MRYAKVENGKVVNVMEADTKPAFASDWIETTTASPGWSYANGVFSPPQVVEPVPQSVSRFQARQALKQAGLYTAVDYAVSQANQRIKDAWKEANVFERDSPSIAALAQALGLTKTQVDDLFRAAAKIKA